MINSSPIVQPRHVALSMSSTSIIKLADSKPAGSSLLDRAAKVYAYKLKITHKQYKFFELEKGVID